MGLCTLLIKSLIIGFALVMGQYHARGDSIVQKGGGQNLHANGTGKY